MSSCYFEHHEKLFFGCFHSGFVGWINHVDHCVGVVVIRAPIRPDSWLASDVPSLELQVLVSHGFDVESNRWSTRHHRAKKNKREILGVVCMTSLRWSLSVQTKTKDQMLQISQRSEFTKNCGFSSIVQSFWKEMRTAQRVEIPKRRILRSFEPKRRPNIFPKTNPMRIGLSWEWEAKEISLEIASDGWRKSQWVFKMKNFEF